MSEMAKLSTILQFKNGKKRPKEDGTIPVYGGNGILGYTNESNNENCIAIGRVGAYCGSVYYEKNRCWISDNAIAASVRNNADIVYCYYLLRTQKLNERRIGTSQPLLTQEILNKIETPILPYEKQIEVGKFLERFDEAIELNEKINDNLEQQMQTIFLNMFPNAFIEINGTVGELISFSNGKKRPDEEGNIPVYGGNGILAYTNVSNNKNCIIIGRVGAYCGNLYYSSQPCWISDNAISAQSAVGSAQLFSYYLLKNASLPNRHIGTSQPLLTQGILNAIPCNMPKIDEINEFNDICVPLQEMIDTNVTENIQLAHLRDTILPKLMSGEIDVSAIQL